MGWGPAGLPTDGPLAQLLPYFFLELLDVCNCMPLDVRLPLRFATFAVVQMQIGDAVCARGGTASLQGPAMVPPGLVPACQ